MYLRSYENLEQNERRKLMAEIENELVIIESDLKRNARKKEDLLLEKRRLNDQILVLQARLEDLSKELKNSLKEEFYFQTEIDRLKKKRNVVGN
ncbi:MAG: hypothetical protein IPN70_04040 [Candidatus Moraniibacteriota bacterium]|nr:MAG: hypothetical protein IPN70_04040 [Candidatus Moranbacteria bacterium]